MTKQTPSSLLLIAAIAGGIGFVAFVALMVVGEFTFSPAAFLAILAALAAAIFLFQGFHRDSQADRPELKAVNKAKLGDVTREPGTAGVTPGSAGLKPGAASGFATAASPAPAPAAPAVPRDESPAPRETPPPSVRSTPAEATEAARGDSNGAAAAGPEDSAKWKSTQLAGTKELAERKGSWTYEREGAPVPEAPPSKAEALGEAPGTAPDPDGPSTAPDPDVGTEPPRMHNPREGGADDLKRIHGVGPKLESMLHRLGIYHFDQIAAWNDDEIAWVDEHLEVFRGRVSRDEWVRQARDLSTERQG